MVSVEISISRRLLYQHFRDLQICLSGYLACICHRRDLLVLQRYRKPEDTYTVVDVMEDILPLLTIPTAHELLLH